MEENSQNEQSHVEEVKTETTNQTKDNANKSKSGKGAAIGEGFKKIFTNPFELIDKAANGPKNYFLLFAVILLVIWVGTALIQSIISTVMTLLNISTYFREGFFVVSKILSVFGNLLAPVVMIAFLSLLVFLFKKGEKKSFITVMISVTIACAPFVVSSILSLLGVFTTNITGGLVSAFATFCLVISSIFMFFTIKALYNQDDNNKVYRKYLIIMGIFYGAQFIYTTVLQLVYNLLLDIF